MVQGRDEKDEGETAPKITSNHLVNNSKGEAEENMLGFATKEDTKGLWETLIVKSGFVILKDIKSPRDFMGWVMGTKACLRVDELTAAMIDAALNGWKENTLQDVQAMGVRDERYWVDHSS
jgi:hypothetical protein